MHRFFVTGTSLSVGRTVELPDLARQLHRVLRLQPGTEIGLLSGDGALYLGTLTALNDKSATALVTDRTTPATEPDLALTLYQCSLKNDKFEWVLQKGTELGVAHFVPVISARSIVRPAAALLKKYTRWRAIVREAAEQSGRTRLPSLAHPLTLTELARTSGTEHDHRFVPWEDAAAGAPSLGTALSAATEKTTARAAEKDASPDNAAHHVSRRVALLIGPEGGLQPEEIALLSPAWQTVTLGARILRAETAALAAVTIIMDRSGEFTP